MADLDPVIFTFYSFKGGVGRSMAALNVAYWLAAHGRHVLLVDMDLEAPGLSGFLTQHGELGSPAALDILDLISSAREVATSEPDHPERQGSIRQRGGPHTYLLTRSVPREKYESMRAPMGVLGSLHVIGADIEREYAARLEALKLSSLSADELAHVSIALRKLLMQHRIQRTVPAYYGDATSEVRPDYILIDSRTGLTEAGGLCVGPLADRLVVICGLNDQNIEGTRMAMETLGVIGGDGPPWEDDRLPPADDRMRPPLLGGKPTLLVASPVPVGLSEESKLRIDQIEQRIGGKVAARLTYHPQMALRERIFVRDLAEEQLASDYIRLAGQMTATISDHPAQFRVSGWSANRDERIQAIHRSVRFAEREPAPGQAVLRALVSQLGKAEMPQDDGEFIAWDSVLRLLTQPGAQEPWVGESKWAYLLELWAAVSKNSGLASLRRSAALTHVQAALSADGLKRENRISIMFLSAKIHAEQGQKQEALNDATTLVEFLPPKERSRALIMRGAILHSLGRSSEALLDFEAALAGDSIDPALRARGLMNRGVALGALGRHEEVLESLERACAIPEFDVADRSRASLIKGIALSNLQRIDAAIAAYTQTIDDPATDSNDLHMALINRADHYIQIGRDEETFADLDRVISGTVDGSLVNLHARTKRASLRLYRDEYQEALEDTTAILRENPQDPKVVISARIVRSHALACSGDIEAARREYQELDPSMTEQQRVEALGGLGWAYYLAKDYQKAIELYQRALATAPNRSLIMHANYGLALLQIGQVAEAKREYQEALQKMRNVRELRSAIRDLEAALVARKDLAEGVEILTWLKDKLSDSTETQSNLKA